MRIASIIVGTVGALGLGALLLNLSGVGPGSASATAHIAQPAPTPASGAAKVKAMQTLMALPELKAWSARLEETSGGQVRGALIEYDSAPKEVAGQRYWQFSFVENGDDAAHPWDSFLVAVHGDQILVGGTAEYPADRDGLVRGEEYVRPILGGTGDYAGADGTMTTVRQSDGSYEQTFEFGD